MPPYSGFKPLVGGGPQHRTPSTGPSASTKSGLTATAPAIQLEEEPGKNRDAALRSTFVDKEEAAMLRAMARLNGDEQKSRNLGNNFSQANRKVAAARQKEAASLGLTPLDPLEQHELQRKLAASQRAPTKTSDRGVRVPRVGMGRGRPQFAPIDFVARRKGEEEIRQEFDDFETPQAPPGAAVRSRDEVKDELALRNQFFGKTPQEVLREAPRQPTDATASAAAAPRPTTLRQQIEDEVAERHEFLDQMRALGRPVDASTNARIECEIADRLQDLKKLEQLGGD